MTESSERQQLPLVELRPFSKKVWRREKSLPDFYERDVRIDTSQTKVETKDKETRLDLSASTCSIIKELEESRRTLIESRHNTIISHPPKSRSHPKAEFMPESAKVLKSNELIPSFVTRMERTKSTLESLNREHIPLSRYALGVDRETNDGERATRRVRGPIKVHGGRMNQRIFKRHLLYLNPLDSYRQVTGWSSSFPSRNTVNPVSSKEIILTRNSFPFSSSKTNRLVLPGTSHTQYPLRPIRADGDDRGSPHKFNSKLGAAKNSLSILSKWGSPTKVEKNLEQEFEMNLERFRRERLLLQTDMKTLSGQFITPDCNNPTRGELSLRQAREANKARFKPESSRMRRAEGEESDDLMGVDKGASGGGDSERGGEFVDTLLHPIAIALEEESEGHADLDTDRSVVSTSRLDRGSRRQINSGRLSTKSLDHYKKSVSSFSNLRQEETTVKKEDDEIKNANTDCGSANGQETMTSQLDNECDRDTPQHPKDTDTSFTTPTDADQCIESPSNQTVELNSPAALSKTNIEYLHNLRRPGLPVVSQDKRNVEEVDGLDNHEYIVSKTHRSSVASVVGQETTENVRGPQYVNIVSSISVSKPVANVEESIGGHKSANEETSQAAAALEVAAISVPTAAGASTSSLSDAENQSDHAVASTTAMTDTPMSCDLKQETEISRESHESREETNCDAEEDALTGGDHSGTLEPQEISNENVPEYTEEVLEGDSMSRMQKEEASVTEMPTSVDPLTSSSRDNLTLEDGDEENESESQADDSGNEDTPRADVVSDKPEPEKMVSKDDAGQVCTPMDSTTLDSGNHTGNFRFT